MKDKQRMVLSILKTHFLERRKQIMGITCVVVQDRIWLDGKPEELTFDWYAQDDSGNVWYFGEDVATSYNPDGSVKDHEGAWQAGVDGAKPGYAMLADPQVGNHYRQEYYFNVAEDEAEVIEQGLTVTVPYGTFQNCIKIKETTVLEADVTGYKYYAPGIGQVSEEEGSSVSRIDQHTMIFLFFGTKKFFNLLLQQVRPKFSGARFELIYF